MRIDIMTLFPDTVNAVLHESILGRAVKKGLLEINCVQIRDFTDNKQKQVDDYPYGGGWGCVMMAQPLKACLDSVLSDGNDLRTRVIYMSPQGKTFDQDTARRLKDGYDRLVLVCGHYEGVDERFIEECVDEELSIGDFVLTGGEIAAMAVADAVCRLVPGVLSDEQCYIGESHWEGLLEYPQYTRPEVWEGREVPAVLLQGDHARIEKWRRRKQLERTMSKRPDLFSRFAPASKEDAALLKEIEKDEKRLKLTLPLSYRPATENDIPDILDIVSYARSELKRHRVDQWQGPYPEKEVFEQDIKRGECFIVTHGDETAGFFTLSEKEEEDYSGITDGKWSSDLPYCVLHRSAVAAKYRGTGLSACLMECVERQCALNGRSVIRVDTHRKNKPMLNLLRAAGFTFRGNIIIAGEEGHDQARQAFDKIIKQQEDKE